MPRQPASKDHFSQWRIRKRIKIVAEHAASASATTKRRPRHRPCDSSPYCTRRTQSATNGQRAKSNPSPSGNQGRGRQEASGQLGGCSDSNCEQAANSIARGGCSKSSKQSEASAKPKRAEPGDLARGTKTGMRSLKIHGRIMQAAWRPCSRAEYRSGRADLKQPRKRRRYVQIGQSAESTKRTATVHRLLTDSAKHETATTPPTAETARPACAPST